jgi:glycosyltransferase involved in cell wall biosynthesis
VPEISVVIPSHRRPLRLRWLLNALEAQTLARERFEVIVAHDAEDEEIAALLRDHPLAGAGVLKAVPSRSTGHAHKRNSGWKLARAPLIAFTDDDCRPPEDWVENALTAAVENPGAIVQGRTLPDPDEWEVELGAPYATTQRIHDPPTPSGQTCNIVYPRELLERLGGFDEEVPVLTGEDTDLLWRALEAGARHVGAERVLTYHAVVDNTLLGRVRGIGRWADLALLFKRHPGLRREVPLRIFWKATHPTLLVAVAGVGAAATRGEPVWALLVVPWARETWPWHGPHARGILRSLSELPARALIDGAEVVALVRGSIRHRTLFL